MTIATTGDTGTTQTPAAPEAPATGTTQAAPPAEQAPVVDTLLTGAEPTGQDGATSQPGTPPTQQPVEIEIKVPDGVQVDEAVLGKFKPLAQEIGLDSAKAQKVVDLYIEAQNGFASKAEAAWNETKEKWREAVKQDPEIGGAKFNETVAMARRAIDKFGGPALKQVLNDLGIGNHPEVVRFAYRIGKAISEDSVAGAAGSAPALSDEEAMLRKAFPSMYK